jgi:hypothetical protein
MGRMAPDYTLQHLAHGVQPRRQMSGAPVGSTYSQHYISGLHRS